LREEEEEEEGNENCEFLMKVYVRE